MKINEFFNKLNAKFLYETKRMRCYLLQEKYPMFNCFLRRKAIKKGALGVILMLHRVGKCDSQNLPPNRALKVSPEFLQSTIDKYRKAGFLFLSLDDIYDIIEGEKKVNRPFVSFTMDDGYLDNYTQAYPIFKRNHVPFCLFIATDFIDKKAILWWYTVETLILTHSSIRLTDGSCYKCDTFQDKWNAFRLLREKILHLDQHHLLELLQQLFSDYHIDWLEPVQNMAMSWENIKVLSEDNLCTIGGHTVSHPAFNQISLEEIKDEIQSGVEKLEIITNHKIEHFAYPYGSINEDGEREYNYLKQFNFKAVYVSFGGYIKKSDIGSMTCLPRHMLQY